MSPDQVKNCLQSIQNDTMRGIYFLSLQMVVICHILPCARFNNINSPKSRQGEAAMRAELGGPWGGSGRVDSGRWPGLDSLWRPWGWLPTLPPSQGPSCPSGWGVGHGVLGPAGPIVHIVISPFQSVLIMLFIFCMFRHLINLACWVRRDCPSRGYPILR